MNKNKKVYLDYGATTPMDNRVVEKMLPYFNQDFGNPSSVHYFGQRAEAAVEESRTLIAEHLNCLPEEIIFTSCGSESNNFALRGVATSAKETRGANHILISPLEHPAVSRTAKQLAEIFEFEIELLPVDSYGIVHPDEVEKRLRPDTAIVSVMYSNNEIGSINPINEIGAICQRHEIPFHTDAVQAAAYLPINVQELNVDLVSLGAHKFYGPKGIGVLYIRKGTPIIPIITGGSQEFGLRAGTSNVPYIVGMAEAFHLANIERDARINHLLPIRDEIINFVTENIAECQLTGHPSQRMPNHASFAFRNIDGNALLVALDAQGFACSSGSACKTGSPEPSEVLTNIGLPRDWALGSLRVTLGQFITPEEIREFLKTLSQIIPNLRKSN